MDICHLQKKISNKYRKKLLDTRLDYLKTASKQVVPKAAVATKPVINENSRNVGEIIIPPEKWEEILNELR